jgi:hypothetical protein
VDINTIIAGAVTQEAHSNFAAAVNPTPGAAFASVTMPIKSSVATVEFMSELYATNSGGSPPYYAFLDLYVDGAFNHRWTVQLYVTGSGSNAWYGPVCWKHVISGLSNASHTFDVRRVLSGGSETYAAGQIRVQDLRR